MMVLGSKLQILKFLKFKIENSLSLEPGKRLRRADDDGEALAALGMKAPS